MKRWANPPEHLMETFIKKGRRTMMITHRGNDLGPENSMKSLIGSLDTNLEGIEADVSIKSFGAAFINQSVSIVLRCG